MLQAVIARPADAERLPSQYEGAKSEKIKSKSFLT